MRIVLIDRHKLSNGDTVSVSRTGRSYSFSRTYADDQAPDVTLGLKKKDALNLLANDLKDDILEVE